MHQLPVDRKLYLLEQHKQSRVASAKPLSHVTQPATYGPSGAGNLSRLVPQLTGDSGLMRRLSVPGWSTASAASPPSASGSNHKGEKLNPSWTSAQAQDAKAAEQPQPLQPQTTGGLWSSWWVSSGGEKNAASQSKGRTGEAKTPKWYVDSINRQPLDTKLVKHLISLRVHLSTVHVFWVKEFVETEGGLDALSAILASLVGRAGKRKHPTDMEDAILLELMKIFRVLSNTEVS